MTSLCDDKLYGSIHVFSGGVAPGRTAQRPRSEVQRHLRKEVVGHSHEEGGTYRFAHYYRTGSAHAPAGRAAGVGAKLLMPCCCISSSPTHRMALSTLDTVGPSAEWHAAPAKAASWLDRRCSASDELPAFPCQCWHRQRCDMAQREVWLLC